MVLDTLSLMIGTAGLPHVIAGKAQIGDDLVQLLQQVDAAIATGRRGFAEEAKRRNGRTCQLQ